MARYMPKVNTMKLSANLLKISLLMALLPASASAVLIFTIDTFTNDELTIGIPEGLATLDATASPPTGIQASYLWLMDASDENWDYIVGTVDTVEFSGAIGGQSPTNVSYQDNYGGLGDGLLIQFSEALLAGDTVTSAISITWSGTDVFDPTEISSLILTWGFDSDEGYYPFGDPQGTTSTSGTPGTGSTAIPDTGSTAAFLGAGVAALVFARRKLA